MKTCRTLLVLPLLAATSIALGCGDSDSPLGPTGDSGTVSFNYTGAVSGNFTATGAVQLTPGANPQPQFGTWAVGVRGPEWLDVAAFRAGSGNRGDWLYLELWRGTGSIGTGTYSIANGDASVEFIVNVGWVDQTTYDRYCWLDTGSVTITSISAQRAQGTFSGQGGCETPAGATGAFQIVGGQFDVPLIADI